MTAEMVTERVLAHVTTKLEAAMSDYMTEMQGQMWTLISVPVQYADKFGVVRGRSRPKPIGSLPGPGLLRQPSALVIRSKKKESPRKEFGNYYESMKVVVRSEGSGVVGILGTDIK